MCLSDAILLETASVLLREHKLQKRYAFSSAQAESFCDGLAAIALMAGGLPDLPDAVPLDPKDNPIVATAVAANADYLVTGDRRHLLKLGSYRGIAIITPRRFLELLG